MEIIELGKLVALDLNSAVASDYDHIQPLPLPGPLVPYQVRRQDDDESDRPKKRRKRSKGLPDSNLDAISRYSPIEQALGEALPSLHSWMAAKSTNSLSKALGAAPPGSQISTITATNSAATAAASPTPPTAPDYVSLASLARVVKPKFSWADCEENTAENEIEEDGEVNLFNHGITNARNTERRGLAFGHLVLIPGRATFLMSDAHALHALMQRESPPPALCPRFHCIVIDPPWENASVKRAAGAAYPTLPNNSLLSLPIKKLAAPNGEVLVCLWVTNREKLRRFVDAELLPAWGLQPVATWHWLKVSDGGAVPVTPLNSYHRRPYESLLLCSAAGVAAPWDGEKSQGLSLDKEGSGGDFKGWRKPAHGLVIAAMPTVHSRKPHLGALLKAILPPGANCLEMFARECHRGWTSWGNEVLKFQGLEYFKATE